MRPLPGGGEDIQAVVLPTSGPVRRPTASAIRARVCAGCGYAELYVEDPALIAERWRAGDPLTGTSGG